MATSKGCTDLCNKQTVAEWPGMGMVAQEVEAGVSLWVWGQPDAHFKFQDSQGYIFRPYLNSKQAGENKIKYSKCINQQHGCSLPWSFRNCVQWHGLHFSSPSGPISTTARENVRNEELRLCVTTALSPQGDRNFPVSCSLLRPPQCVWRTFYPGTDIPGVTVR